MSEILHIVMEVCIGIFGVAMLCAFVRALRGPRFTDRIVAINMIGTMTTAVICILSVYLDATSLLDVALVYTLLSFLATVVMCHVVVLHHKGRKLHLGDKKEESEAEEKK